MGKLFIVPTPIGNLKDITLRALEVLKEVDKIFAEDTRSTGILLKHYQIKTKMASYHKFNEHRSLNKIIEEIQNGIQIALVSDSGTPGISDPGFLLIRECIKKGIDVECLPGATALIPAIVNSGLPNNRFCFEGFLPHKKGRQKQLKQLINENRTMIFYESPHRLLKTLAQFLEFFGNDRNISISRELTKIHEETIRGTIPELIHYFNNKKIKGEIVIVIEGKE